MSRTYTSLGLLGGKAFSEQQVAGAVQNDQGLFGVDNLSTLTSPGTEMESWIISQTNLGEQVTVKKIVGRFESKPYGWNLGSIEVVLGWLVGTGKIALSIDATPVVRTEVAALIKNTAKQQHTVAAPQKAYEATKVAAFKKFCTEFFDEGAVPSDPAELARFGKDKLAAKREELNALVSTSRYPFVSQLAAVVALLDQVTGKPVDWYLAEFNTVDELLEAKGDTIDPIKAFLKGQQAKIYDEAVGLLTANAGNLDFLPEGSADNVKTLLADPNAFRGNKMNQLKAATDALKSLLDDQVTGARTAVKSVVETKLESLLQEHFYKAASPDAQNAAVDTVNTLLSTLDSQNLIAVVHQAGSQFESTTYPGLIDQLTKSADTGGKPQKPTVAVASIKAAAGPAIIETESDVDAYLAALRVALVQAIKENRIAN